jgi:hypothetical protein
VYIMKRRGPRTDPCGTPQEEVVDVDLWPLERTVKDREVK